MRFQIIRDVELAKELAKSDLLWWVNPEDGGDAGYCIFTCPYGLTVIDSHVQSGVVGIRVED